MLGVAIHLSASILVVLDRLDHKVTGSLVGTVTFLCIQGVFNILKRPINVPLGLLDGGIM